MTIMTMIRESRCWWLSFNDNDDDDESKRKQDESAPDLNAPLTLLHLLLPLMLVFLRSPDHALMLLFCDDNGNTRHKLQRQMLIMWRGNDAPNPNHCDYCFHFCLGNWYWESQNVASKLCLFLKIVWMWQIWRCTPQLHTWPSGWWYLHEEDEDAHKWPSGWWCVTAMSQTAVPA